MQRLPILAVIIVSTGLKNREAETMIQVRIFLFYWLPLLIYLVLIFTQSAFPAPQTGLNIPHLDKWVHAAIYGLLGILFCRAYGRTWPRMDSRWLMILSILSAALFGLSDEIHQYFVPSRSADRMDLLADFLGSAVGVSIYTAVRLRKRLIRTKSAIDKNDNFL